MLSLLQNHRTEAKKFLTLLLLLLLPSLAAAYEFGINIHGFSYHPDRTDSTGMRFKEFNPGIGARLILSESKRNVWLLESGLYRNSSDDISKYAGGGYRFKLRGGFEIGPSVVIYQNPDQNSGKVFVAPLLVLSFRYKRVLFHAVPVPRYKDINRNAVIGLYGTVNIFSSGQF